MRISATELSDYDHLVRPDAVHGAVYTDPQVFADEQERIFSRSWVYIGHDSEIPAAGDFKRSTLGVQPVIFCRDESDRVHVLFNRCRHRAAVVCLLESGQGTGFRCEYHGWHYRLNGELAGVPYSDAYEEFDMNALGLTRPPRIAQYRGFVFASLAAEGTDLPTFLGRPCMDQIDLFCDLSPTGRIVVRAGAAKLAYDGNWKLQMENSIDGYHPNFTHQSFFAEIRAPGGARVDMFDGNSPALCRALGNGHTLLDYRGYNRAGKGARLGALKSTPWGRRYYEDLTAAHGRERAEEVLSAGGTHMNVFPNLVVLGQQVRTIRPVRHDRTEVVLAPALLEGVPDEVNTQRLRAYEAFYSPRGGGIHDDIEMFTRVTEGLRCTQNPWLLFRRGLHRERQDEDGTIVGQVTDEVSQRAMWRHWKASMGRG